MKLWWPRFTRAELVERMYLLVRVALLPRTTAGRAAEESEPTVRVITRTKGRGYRWFASAPTTWQEASKRLRLRAGFLHQHRRPPPSVQVAHRPAKLMERAGKDSKSTE